MIQYLFGIAENKDIHSEYILRAIETCVIYSFSDPEERAACEALFESKDMGYQRKIAERFQNINALEEDILTTKYKLRENSTWTITQRRFNSAKTWFMMQYIALNMVILACFALLFKTIL